MGFPPALVRPPPRARLRLSFSKLVVLEGSLEPFRAAENLFRNREIFAGTIFSDFDGDALAFKLAALVSLLVLTTIYRPRTEGTPSSSLRESPLRVTLTWAGLEVGIRFSLD